MSQFFASCGQSIGVLASASVLPMNIQDWSPLGWTGWISLQSKELLRVFSNTTVQKHQFFDAHLSLLSNSHIHTRLFPGGSDSKASAYNAGNPGSILGSGRSSGEGNGNPLQYSCLENPMAGERGRLQSMGSQRVGHNWVTALSFFLSHSYMTTGKTTALTRWTFVGKIMSLLFNMLSRLVIAFLSRSKLLSISWLQSPSAVILEPKKIQLLSFHCFPMYICLLQHHHTPYGYRLSLDLISFTTSPCVCVCVCVYMCVYVCMCMCV